MHEHERGAQPTYETIDSLVSKIEGPNGEACAKILEEFRQLFTEKPGSSKNHQAWIGGYYDHVTEIMNIVSVLYHTMDNIRPLPFSESDALLITFLHDLEKPFKYSFDANGDIVTGEDFKTKAEGEAFKRDKMKEFGIELTSMQENGLKFVEGIRDNEYRRDSRVMSEFAALCHMADLWSARGWYNYPLPFADSWHGAKRVNPAAHAVWLETEFPPGE